MDAPRSIYERGMHGKENGIANYYPDCDESLPRALRERGISVGDVGFWKNGKFNYLFNSTSPSEHAVNQGRVPYDFVPIHFDESKDISFSSSHYMSPAVLHTTSVTNYDVSASAGVDSSALSGVAAANFRVKFSRENAEGAILVLPDGGSRYDILPIKRIKTYIEKYAQTWFAYFEDDYEIDDLFVVTGCDKAASWGTATFSGASSGADTSILFEAATIGQLSGSVRYSWTATSTDCRTGPGLANNFGKTCQNQCIFMRGLWISLRKDSTRSRRRVTVKVVDETDPSNLTSKSKSRFNAGRGSVAPRSISFRFSAGRISQRSIIASHSSQTDSSSDFEYGEYRFSLADEENSDFEEDSLSESDTLLNDGNQQAYYDRLRNSARNLLPARSQISDLFPGTGYDSLFAAIASAPDDYHLSDTTVADLLEVDKLKSRLQTDNLCIEDFQSFSPKFIMHFMDLLSEIRQSSTDGVQKRRCFKYLRKFAYHFGCLPRSWYLEDVAFNSSLESIVTGGGHSDIFQGTYQGSTVCVKRLRAFPQSSPEDSRKLLKDLCREAVAWKTLSHSNVLPVYGILTKGTNPCLVSPWMKNGNVNMFLGKNPTFSRLKLVRDCLEGVEYVHSMHLGHGDIRGDNLLVTEDHIAVLADFGEVRFSQSLNGTTTGISGTLRWLSPEVLNTARASECVYWSIDIYAVGCTIIELYTGKRPFHHIQYEPQVACEVVNGAKPPLPRHVVEPQAPKLWEIVDACLSNIPANRPRAVDLRQSFCFDRNTR